MRHPDRAITRITRPDAENPDWEGNCKVRHRDPAWQAIIAGNDASCLKRVIDAGFDGVYLGIVDGFEHFEEKWAHPRGPDMV